MTSTEKQSANKTLQSQTEERALLSEKPCADSQAEASFRKRRVRRPQTPEQEAKKEMFDKTLAWLCETFPDCFDLSNPKPLKKHIEMDIFIHLSQEKRFSKRSIRGVLAFYVRQNKYHKTLLENQHRFNLAGIPSEEVSLADKDHARVTLEMRAKSKSPLARKSKN